MNAGTNRKSYLSSFWCVVQILPTWPYFSNLKQKSKTECDEQRMGTENIFPKLTQRIALVIHNIQEGALGFIPRWAASCPFLFDGNASPFLNDVHLNVPVGTNYGMNYGTNIPARKCNLGTYESDCSFFLGCVLLSFFLGSGSSFSAASLKESMAQIVA